MKSLKNAFETMMGASSEKDEIERNDKRNRKKTVRKRIDKEKRNDTIVR